MNSSSVGELPAPVTGRRSTMKWAIAGGTAGVALTLDLLTKRWALSSLYPDERLQLLPFLHIQRTSNTGVAFGLLAGRTGLILLAAGLSLLVVLLYVVLESRPLLGGLAGGMLLGGSLGNLVERIASGAVTDFIKLAYWPTFNLADVFLVTGVGLVIVSLFLGSREQEEQAAGP
jgi:signal peptidase II